MPRIERRSVAGIKRVQDGLHDQCSPAATVIEHGRHMYHGTLAFAVEFEKALASKSTRKTGMTIYQRQRVHNVVGAAEQGS